MSDWEQMIVCCLCCQGLVGHNGKTTRKGREEHLSFDASAYLYGLFVVIANVILLSRCSKLFYYIKVSCSHICRTLS